MRFRRVVFCAAIALLMLSCKTEIKTDDVVGKVAEQYFAYFLNGDYEAYVDAVYRPEPLRISDRSELIDNLKMFAAAQEKERGGIKTAETSRVEVSGDGASADVFLLLTYGDGSQELILLPMICRDGLWYLR